MPEDSGPADALTPAMIEAGALALAQYLEIGDGMAASAARVVLTAALPLLAKKSLKGV